MAKLILDNKNYCCTVVDLQSIRKHSNADRLNLTTVFGNQIIIGLDTKIGDRVLYFPLESQLGEGFANANNLVRKKDPVTGQNIGGLFEEKRRVRCQKLRGEKSEGFVIPLSSLEYLRDPDLILDLKPGDEFNSVEVDGVTHPICSKYVVPLTKREQRAKEEQERRENKAGVKSWSRMIPGQFALHYDTEQLMKNLHKLQPTSIVSVTTKLHGTSFVVSKCLVKRKLSFWEKLAQRVGIPVNDVHYDYVWSSRRVVKNNRLYEVRPLSLREKLFGTSAERAHALASQGCPDYYGGDLYGDIASVLKGALHDGETVYGEAVGFTKEGRAIQPGYDYGCGPNEFHLYVYRITHTNPEGKVVELSWPQLQERTKEIQEVCQEFLIDSPALLYYGQATDYLDLPMAYNDEQLRDWRERFGNGMRAKVESMGNAKLCRGPVPEEGVVVRIEGLKPEAFKLKSFAFLGKETECLDKGEVGMEEEQSDV